MINSTAAESPTKEDKNIDKRLSAETCDRLLRRMSKFRVHQTDCELKNELGLRELCQHESDLIKKLQQQKVDVGKQKRLNKNQTRKRKVEPQTSSEAQNDLSDLNYNEMLTLLSNEQSRFPLIEQLPQQQQPSNIILCSCTPNSLHNVYDHLQHNAPYFF